MQLFLDRQALHRIPELDRHLPKTLGYLESHLKGQIFFPMEGAVCAFFDFGRDHALAFRSDMDALPTGHCCGHDGHMAILLALSRQLAQMQDLPHNILLIFQPAEETTGGAEDLCRRGLLTQYRVRAIFGLHIWPGLPQGQIFSRPGPMMARSCQIHVTVQGTPGHIAAPGADAVEAAAEFVCRVRWDSPQGLLKFGLFQAGTAGNIMAPQARLQGSLRCFREDLFQEQRRFLQRQADKVGKLTGCGFSLELSEGYPPVTNDPALLQAAMAVADIKPLPKPSWLSEDFSCYQQHIPGVYFFLGAGDGPALHSPDFDFPLEILEKGLALWTDLAAHLQLPG